MAKLIINSDDFGYSKGINHAILDTHIDGVLTSTTLLANMPGFEHAVALAKANQTLGIGVHLSMTLGEPILNNVDQLINEKGEFKQLKDLKDQPQFVCLEQLYDEWDAQIKKVKTAGINITHLDSHHYAHSYGDNYQVIEALAEKYKVPLRNCFGVKSKLIKPELAPADAFWNLFNYPSMKVVDQTYSAIRSAIFEIISRDAEKHKDSKIVEAVCHPGYVDSAVWLGSSFNLARMREVEVLCDLGFKKYLLNYGYELCRYDEV